MSAPNTPVITEDLLIARKANDEETMASLLNLEWEQFVDNRIIRIYLPSLDGVTEYEKRSHNFIDVNLTGHTSDEIEGRKKKKKKKKLAKILKKAFQIIGKVVVLKLILLKPIILKLLLLKALMALMMGKMGFMMSAGMMIMKMMQNKSIQKLIGGGGGCSCGGGKGGGKGGCGCGGDSYAPSGVSDVEWQGGGGGGGVSGGGWSSGGGGGGGYDRSFSHDSAYSYYSPDREQDLTKGDTSILPATNSSQYSHNAPSQYY